LKKAFGLSPYSVASRPMELLANGNSLGTATCFFIGYGANSNAMLTNWHVLSGRDPNTGQPRHKTGAIPDTARVLQCCSEKLGTFEHADYSLLKDDHTSTWYQHPKGQKYDIATLILQPNASYSFFPAIRDDETADLYCPAGREVFIIGYPLGVTKQPGLPIWKRGSIASEPDLDADDLPIFLVDSVTREGMSGSPVFGHSMDLATKKDGGGHIGGGPHVRFLGMYSGRYGTAIDDELSIGRVWKREVIEEMLQTPSPGSYDLLP
jgi:hypothetical protein